MNKFGELLPCPFCGGEANMVKRGTRFGPICYVQCDTCGAQTRVKSCEEEVASDDWDDKEMRVVARLWNHRI